MNNNSSDDLRKQLLGLGAREYEIVALCMDPVRGSAALDYAIAKGADHPISYAIKLFDDPNWNPAGERTRRATNVSVDVRCTECSGDRFVLHRTREDGSEEVKPCPSCNASLDAGFWKADGSRFVVAK